MSKGSRVTVDGRLRGMDTDVLCKVTGLQISPPDAVVFEITDINILDFPKNLPDGIYELSYEGSAERVRKTGKIWDLV